MSSGMLSDRLKGSGHAMRGGDGEGAEPARAPTATSGPFYVGNEEVNVQHHGERYNVPIPYAFTIGAVTFVGILYLKDPIENSYTDGYFGGAVNGNYHIDKDETEVCATGLSGTVKACIWYQEEPRKIQARVGTKKLTGGWDWSDWKTIVSW